MFFGGAGRQSRPDYDRADHSRIRACARALAPGELCAEPVATRYGFHIVRLARKTEGRVVPYEAVAEHIADYLRESVQRRAKSQYVARLASGARIEGVELASAEALRVH